MQRKLSKLISLETFVPTPGINTTVAQMISTKKIFLTISAWVIFCAAMAQTPIDLPKILPPSPDAAALMRYGEIPVDYSTGVPKIEIPIYTLQSRKLSLPISISYHAAGIRVKDISSIVGLGWVLNAGGIITSTRMDRGDQNLEDINYRVRYKTVADWQNAKTTAENQGANSTVIFGQSMLDDYDSRNHQCDRYFYQTTSGKTGIFRFDFLNNALVKLPYDPIKIEKSTDGKTFTTSEVDGTISTYQQIANTSSSSGSWYLTNISTADQSDQIQLVYDNQHVNSYVQYFYAEQVDWGDYFPSPNFSGGQGCPTGNPNPQFTINYSQSNQTVSSTSPLLQSIITSNAIVNFYYASDRVDGPQYRITEIKITDKATGALIKDFRFTNQSYFGNATDQNQRLKLTGLTVSDNQNTPVQNYAFVYDESVALPPYNSTDVSGNYHNQEDFWGYYNGAALSGMIPAQFMPSNVSNVYKGDRDPNPFLAKAAMLKEIHYPTGGLTKFEYEPNYVANAYNYYSIYNPNPNPGKDYVGGFRIKRIRSFASQDTLITESIKTYDYGAGQTAVLNQEAFTYGQRYFFNYNDGRQICGDYNFVGNRTIANSSTLMPLVIGNGDPIVYTSVTEYVGTQGNNIGKTNYYYSSPNYSVSGEDPRRALSQPVDYGMYTPRLLTKITSKNTNGTYQAINTVNNTYTAYRSNQFQAGISVFHNTSYSINGTNLQEFDLDQSGVPIVNDFSNGYDNYFTYSDILMFEEVNLLTQTDETDSSDPTHPITQTTSYQYADLEHLQPTQKTTTGSTSDTWITQYKYPVDFSSTAPYSDMYSTYHIWSPVIEQLTYKNNTANLLSGVKTDYLNWGNNIIEPQLIKTKKGGNNYEARLQYNGYDSKGNVQSVSKTNGSEICYVYGYGGVYPIAKVESSNYNTVQAALGGQTAVENFRDNLSPTNAAVNAFLAPLRTIAGAQVSTYTYIPLVGMTSATDAKGVATYYEYDSSNRLRIIKNKDGNIVKAFCYNYAGQATGCLVPQIQQSTQPPMIYARIEYGTSPSYAYNNFYNGYNNWEETESEDVRIVFYSDAACTVPYTLTADLTIDVQDDVTMYDDINGQSGSSTSNTYVVPAGNSSYSLGTLSVYDVLDVYDDYWNYVDATTTYYNYTVIPRFGGVYTAEASTSPNL